MDMQDGFAFEKETMALVMLFTQCIGSPLDDDASVDLVAAALERMDKGTMGMVVIDLLTVFVHTAQELKKARNGA